MKAKGLVLAAIAMGVVLTTQPVNAMHLEGDKTEGKAITAKDIDKTARALRRAVCGAKNSKNALTKAKHVQAANNERKRIADMRAALEAEGKLDELSRLDSAAKNAEALANC